MTRPPLSADIQLIPPEIPDFGLPERIRECPDGLMILIHVGTERILLKCSLHGKLPADRFRKREVELVMTAGTAPNFSNQYLATAMSCGVSGQSFQLPNGRWANTSQGCRTGILARMTGCVMSVSMFQYPENRWLLKPPSMRPTTSVSQSLESSSASARRSAMPSSRTILPSGRGAASCDCR